MVDIELAIACILIATLVMFIAWQRRIINEQNGVIEIWKNSAYSADKRYDEMLKKRDEFSETQLTMYRKASESVIADLRNKIKPQDTTNKGENSNG